MHVEVVEGVRFFVGVVWDGLGDGAVVGIGLAFFRVRMLRVRMGVGVTVTVAMSMSVVAEEEEADDVGEEAQRADNDDELGMANL